MAELISDALQQLRSSDWTAWASVTVACVIAATALLGLVITRSFQARETLATLVRRFHEGCYFVVMWRMEQLTRPTHAPFSTAPCLVGDIRSKYKLGHPARKLFERALGSDWDVQEATMHELHYFALQVQAWRRAALPLWRWRRTQLLNNEFGPTLLSTLVNHQLAALRLRRNEDEPASYFATQYGLFDEAYGDLVDRLASDLLERRRPLGRQRPRDPTSKALEKRLKGARDGLDELEPEDSLLVARAEAADVVGGIGSPE